MLKKTLMIGALVAVGMINAETTLKIGLSEAEMHVCKDNKVNLGNGAIVTAQATEQEDGSYVIKSALEVDGKAHAAIEDVTVKVGEVKTVNCASTANALKFLITQD